MKQNIAQPAQAKPLHKQGIYNIKERQPQLSVNQLSVNQQRAAELYPHRLITPAGVGNGIDQGQNKRRFAL